MSTKSFQTVLLEAVLVGLLLIPFTFIAGIISKVVTKKPSLPEICKSWNQFYIMEVTLIIAGILFHLVFEYLGINKRYVDSYYI